MKWIIYGVLIVLFSGALFLPEGGSVTPRNLPLLIGIVCAIVFLYLIGVFRYLLFMWKVKRTLEKKGLRARKAVIVPLPLRLFGRYSMSFSGKSTDLNITFMIAKRRNYYFADVSHLELYKHSAYAIVGGKNNRSLRKVSGETHLVGKQKLLWGELNVPHTTYILLFNKFPTRITDSIKREELGNGDVICSSSILLMDWKGLCRRLEENEI